MSKSTAARGTLKKPLRPKEDNRSKGGRQYLIQKHDASRLHYDFRLELDGVLKSWAVPKGPSLDATKKTLAAHVEDHPLEYGSFEGVIPQGEYGGGTVMLWDRDTWKPEGDPEESYQRGKLVFRPRRREIERPLGPDPHGRESRRGGQELVAQKDR